LLLLLVSLVGLTFTLNAYRPPRSPSWLAVVSFFAGWLTSELALHHLLWQVLAVFVFIHAGALTAWPGQLGLLLCFVSWFLLLRAWRHAGTAELVVAAAFDRALPDLVRAPIDLDGLPKRWRQLAFPIPVSHPGLEYLRDIPFHQQDRLTLRLDVVRRAGLDFSAGARRPALIYAHGGGWVIGSKQYQGLPLIQRMAARGWVCFNIDYRLSPRATFPDHIIDVKRAIAWVRAHAADYGVDPDFIVIAGNSAGGHLASLAALTPGQPELQPGFEDADTSVAGCCSFYGVYDFTDRHGHWPHPGLLNVVERYVLKARLDDARELYTAASPISWVNAGAPPFLVVHGERDSLVTVDEARTFVDALSTVSAAPCVYFEVPGAQHAFEVFPSPRTLHVLDGTERFLSWLRERASSDASAAS
jgi:acetyl esterase/lipase